MQWLARPSVRSRPDLPHRFGLMWENSLLNFETAAIRACISKSCRAAPGPNLAVRASRSECPVFAQLSNSRYIELGRCACIAIIQTLLAGVRSVGARQLDQPQPDRDRCGLSAVCRAKLSRGLVEIGTHGSISYPDCFCDVRHRHAVCEPAQAFGLAR